MSRTQTSQHRHRATDPNNFQNDAIISRKFSNSLKNFLLKLFILHRIYSIDEHKRDNRLRHRWRVSSESSILSVCASSRVVGLTFNVFDLWCDNCQHRWKSYQFIIKSINFFISNRFWFSPANKGWTDSYSVGSNT